MKPVSPWILVLAAALILIVAPVWAAKQTALDASPDETGLLVLDLSARSRMIGLANGLSIDGCAIANVLQGGAGWDMNSLTEATSLAGAQVFAAKPGHYRLFMAEGSRREGAGWTRETISFLESPLPQLSVEIRKGQVAYLGTVKVDVFLPPRLPGIEIALDAEREQKLLSKLADKSDKSRWGPLLRRAASPEVVAADIAAARARASAPAESLPAIPVISRQSMEDHEAQQKSQSQSVMASATRAPAAGRHPEDRLLFVMSGDKQGLIDTLGRVVVEPEFDWTSSSSEGRAKVARNGLSGYVDGTGRMVIEPKWQSAYSFVDGLARVETDVKYGHNREVGTYREGPGKNGWIDRDGNVVITPQYADVRLFSEGYAWVSDGKQWGVIDRSGRFRVDPRFQQAPEGNFSSGLCPVWLSVATGKKNKSEDLVGYIDTSGVTVIPAQFAAAASFSEGEAAVMKGGKVGFIDRSGNMTIVPRFERGRDGRLPRFTEGLAAVNLEGRYGFVDPSGKLVIEPQFESADEFHDGLALVVSGDKIGYIDKAGRMVIAPQFSRGDSFQNGIARVEVRPWLWGYIRRDGSFIWNPVPGAGH
ncbi:MAG TPA: WG repeat-containing protein [Planctomycetota bacterium]|nr:WG repeat-containing protein [Planctomycetota bacterium]